MSANLCLVSGLQSASRGENVCLEVTDHTQNKKVWVILVHSLSSAQLEMSAPLLDKSLQVTNPFAGIRVSLRVITNRNKGRIPNGDYRQQQQNKHKNMTRQDPSNLCVWVNIQMDLNSFGRKIAGDPGSTLF